MTRMAHYVLVQGEQQLLGVDLDDDEVDRLVALLKEDLAQMDLPTCSEPKTRPATAKDLSEDVS